MQFNGEDSGGTETIFATIFAQIGDVTNGTEDGILKFKVISGNSFPDRLTLQGSGPTIFSDQNVQLGEDVNLVFEGATDNSNDTTLGVIDPTGNRVINLPDVSGTVALTSQLGSKSFPIDGNTDLGALDGNDKFFLGQSFTTSSTLDINFDMNTDPKGGLATEDMGSVA